MPTKVELREYLSKTFDRFFIDKDIDWEFIEPLQEEASSLTYATTINDFHIVTTLNPDMLTMTCKIISLNYAVIYYSNKKISASNKEAEICIELNKFKQAAQFQLFAP